MQRLLFDLDSTKQVDSHGIEYWSSRDLMCLLGYNNEWKQFENVIKRAMTVCEKAGNIVQNHFTSARVVVDSSSDTEVDDYHLSRLACYLLIQNGDPCKPEIAAAQLYFAVSTRSNEMQSEQVMYSSPLLADAAYQAGVQSKNFGRFNDAGYLGMYKLTAQEIKEHKGIPAKEELLDNIGSAELAANYFRITQTEDKLKRESITGEENANQAHYDVGRIVRNAIEQVGGQMPEDLPSAPSIKKLLDEKRREQRKRLKDRPQQNEPNRTDQGKLFE